MRTLESHFRLLFLAQKIGNRRWLYLDNHLEKAVGEYFFHQNIYS
jgi:hypothetical protein